MKMTMMTTKLLVAIVMMMMMTLTVFVSASTDYLDIMALQHMYKAMNMAEQLKGWKDEGADPCEQAWMGVECDGPSVIHIKLQGLGLGGFLSSQLYNLRSLKILDVSENQLQGEIPFGLPPNVTQINLSSNNFSLSIPPSLASMINLRHLNLSHNTISGAVADIFSGLQNLKEMDLSYNKLSGDLPSSFASLRNLTRLFLQNNEFTGSVVFLAELELTDLNIQDNNFSGIIPQHFQTIPNLWIGGNKFHVVNYYPPWDFPFDKDPREKNISTPPTAESSAIVKYPSNRLQGREKVTSPGSIALIVFVVAAFGVIVAVGVAIHLKQAQLAHIADAKTLNDSFRSTSSFTVTSTRDYSSGKHEGILPVSFSGRHEEIQPISFSSGRHEEILTLPVINTPPVVTPKTLPPVHQIIEDGSRRSFSRKAKIPPSAKRFRVADLQQATNSFSEDNFLGEGSLGSVFKAEFHDGQNFAVKNINMVLLSFNEEEQFMDIVRAASRLKHPNIVRLVGYCVEHGQHLLVYEYVGTLTLDQALHCEFLPPLNWDLRIQIAIGVAEALNYMHSLSPPVAHCNIKAANILLDEEIRPRLADCGISVLRPLTSNSVKLKASEMAISDSGYVAPEHGEVGTENTKNDVYAFGILLLELLTGKRPFDSSRPKEERSLVKWASYQLHDGSSLEDMVDPGMRKSLSAKALSRFADIISLCIQPEREFRPPLSEIVDALSSLLPKPGTDGFENDVFERSFRSTHTRFLASPPAS